MMLRVARQGLLREGLRRERAQERLQGEDYKALMQGRNDTGAQGQRA